MRIFPEEKEVAVLPSKRSIGGDSKETTTQGNVLSFILVTCTWAIMNRFYSMTMNTCCRNSSECFAQCLESEITQQLTLDTRQHNAHQGRNRLGSGFALAAD